MANFKLLKMRKILLFSFLFACSDSGLPSNPKISKLQSYSNGDSLIVYWNPIEGADYYRIYNDNNLLYEGKDTNVTLGYTKTFKIEAIGLNDKVSTSYNLDNAFYQDSIYLIPQLEAVVFEFPKLLVSSINDTTKFQKFAIFLAQDTSKINKPNFNKDSLKIYSASLFFNKLSRHKISFYNNENIVPFPNNDSLKLEFKKNYILYFNPDTNGWDNQNDYFIKFSIDTIVFSVDSLNDTTYRLKLNYKVRTISGLRWF